MAPLLTITAFARRANWRLQRAMAMLNRLILPLDMAVPSRSSPMNETTMGLRGAVRASQPQ